MKLSHFERLAPICAACRKGTLVLSKVEKGTPRELEEGLLECPECRHLFPVIDGIPVLARDLRRVLSEQVLGLLQRTDLSETSLGLIGEACGSGSVFDSTRQHISSYSHGHWEDGGVVRILEAGLARARAVDGPILDVGCSVGGTTLHLASRGPVVGVDINLSMLRAARRFLREGRVTYARRVSGLIYEERDLPIDVSRAADVDFWCADALALPFRAGTFGLVSSLNLLDCVPSPLELLRGLSEVMKAGGAAIVGTPFDWAPTATPVEQWLGGHSRHKGPEVVRALAGSEQLRELRVEAEEDGLEWPVRLHERAEMRYRVALFVLRKLPLSA